MARTTTTVKTNPICKKPNFLIKSNHPMGLVAHKVMNVCLYLAQEHGAGNGESPTVINVTDKELREYLSLGSTGREREMIHEAIDQMFDSYMHVNIPTIGWVRVHIFRVLGRSHELGSYRFIVDDLVSHLILNPQIKYTRVELLNMKKFSTVHALKLYELLKSEAYNGKWVPDADKKKSFSYAISLDELKAYLGLVQISDRAIEYLKDDANVSIEELIDQENNKKYEDWKMFKRRILEPDIKTINDVTELSVTYDVERSGRGAKISGVVFHIVKEKAASDYKEKDGVKEEHKSLPDEEFMNMLKEYISSKDAELICKTAGNDVKKIKNAVEALASNASGIENPTGFLLSAVKDGYAAPKKKNAKDRNSLSEGHKKNSFINFNQRQYNNDDLERFLLETNPPCGKDNNSGEQRRN